MTLDKLIRDAHAQLWQASVNLITPLGQRIYAPHAAAHELMTRAIQEAFRAGALHNAAAASMAAVSLVDPAPPAQLAAKWALPERLRGDGPCGDCGTEDNIRWFVESVFWNEVVRRPNDGYDGILCIPCFVKRVDGAGLHPISWRLMPNWHWESTEEFHARKATEGQ